MATIVPPQSTICSRVLVTQYTLEEKQAIGFSQPYWRKKKVTHFVAWHFFWINSSCFINQSEKGKYRTVNFSRLQWDLVLSLGYRTLFSSWNQIVTQRSFIKTLQFLPSGKQNDIHILFPVKVRDSVESYGINCLLIGQVGCEDSGRQKALDHSIYYQVDLISTARWFDELL